MKTLVLLHGATGTQAQLRPLKQRLATEYSVHTLSFPGHGDAEPTSHFSIPVFAQSVKEFVGRSKASFFGYSMGGYVALYLARHYPKLVESVITLGTKFHWNPEAAASQLKMLNPKTIEQKVPQFAESLRKQHGAAEWKAVLNKTGTMMKSLGDKAPLTKEDFAALKVPVLVMVGDRDKVVSPEETIDVYRSLPRAELSILPQTGHPIETVDVKLLQFHIKRFLDQPFK